MSKDTRSVLERVQALYSKDTTMKRILSSATITSKVYTELDGIALPEGNAIRALTGLACIPFSKVVQVMGPPDCGKSTTAAEVAIAAQKAGFKIVYWDAEDKLDLARFKEMGGDPESVYLIKTNEIRKGGQLVKDFIGVIKSDNSEEKILAVWDSVGASMSRSETERNLADEKHNVPGADAKENGSVIRHLVGQFNLYPDSVCVLLVNQTYAKIGFMQHGTQAKGGSGIEYFSSLIIGLKRIKVLTKVENKRKVKTGILTRATVTKNHLSQGKNSVYQMDFVITAAGSQVTEMEESADDEEENS